MIKAVEYSEIPQCVQVICDSFLTVAEQFGITKENAPRFTAFATNEAKLRYWIEEQHRPMFAYYADGRPVGYYNLYFPDADECELGSLCVLPAYRHSGIGEALLLDALRRAKEHGCSVMKLSIVEENTVLLKWYEAHGFTHTNTIKFDFFPFTCGYLEKNL